MTTTQREVSINVAHDWLVHLEQELSKWARNVEENPRLNTEHLQTYLDQLREKRQKAYLAYTNPFGVEKNA